MMMMGDLKVSVKTESGATMLQADACRAMACAWLPEPAAKYVAGLFGAQWASDADGGMVCVLIYQLSPSRVVEDDI